jgi:hypothetical protein
MILPMISGWSPTALKVAIVETMPDIRRDSTIGKTMG